MISNSTKYLSNRDNLKKFIPCHARKLLDIGCAAGNFGANLKVDRDIEIWGVEPNESAAREAAAKLDHMINGEFSSELAIPNNYFDVVSFMDSLEHFPETGPPLQLAKKKLNNSGVVIASIPNVRYIENVRHFLLDMDWKYGDEGVLDRTHLRFFTAKSIERTFEEAGYDVKSITGINPHYWSGKKIFLLRLFFEKYVKDMKYLQYVVIAKPRR